MHSKMMLTFSIVPVCDIFLCKFQVGIEHELLARINSSHLKLTEDDGINDVHQNVAELNFFYGIGELILKENFW